MEDEIETRISELSQTDDIEELLSAIEDATYKLGELSGMERISIGFMANAVTEFASGNDDSARLYRKLAQEIKVLSGSERKKYNESYSPLRNAALKRLDSFQLVNDKKE